MTPKIQKIPKTPFLCLLCAALLLSCGENSTAEPVETSEPISQVETVSEITFLSTDDTGYTLIRPDTADESEINGAQEIYLKGIEKYALKPKFETDFVRKGDSPDANPNEILIGMTNRTASTEAYAKISEDEFILAVIDGRLVVLGYTPALTQIAAELLIDQYMTDEGLILQEDFMEIYEAEKTYTYRTFTNPVCESGADPWVIRDGDNYYYCYSGGDGVCVNKIESLDQITSDGGTKVYTAPKGTAYSSEYWAPELHKIDGKWYIYVAADDGDNYNHRMYVLECTGDDPTEPFKMLGKITDGTDKWAIDGTVLQYKGECYFIWSGWAGDVNVAQNIYIAHMSNPYTIDSERVLLSTPEYRWEKLGGQPTINEGPVALVSNDTVHIIYSASGSWSDHYCLGKLTFDGTGDILDPANWTKSAEAVFSKTDSVFGPGHCSFTTAADGSTWIVYHANLISSTGWNGRSVWTQKVEWDGDDIILGTPASPDTEHMLPILGYSKDAVKLKT